MLYNYIQCPHRLYLDLFEDPAKRNPESSFVRLLWERGIDFEEQVVAKLGIPFLDLSTLSGTEKEIKTKEALRRGAALIYNGRISTDHLVGEPDFLLKRKMVISETLCGAALKAKIANQRKPKSIMLYS